MEGKKYYIFNIKRNGKGVNTWSDGSIYEGEW